MGETIKIDLHKSELFGFEREKSRLVVMSIMKGIQEGDEFPPVPIMKKMENSI